MVTNYIKLHKKKILFHLGVLIVFIAGIVLVFNDYELYHDKTIMKITEVENKYDHENIGQDGETEKYYLQIITGEIKNGSYQGQVVTTQNEYSDSKVFDDQYEEGDELFVTLSQNKDSSINCSIIDIKRDKYLAILIVILLWGILVVTGKRGLFAILSVIVNIVLLTVALQLYSKGHDILNIFNCLVILYTIFCMVLNSGFIRKTVTSIVSIVIALFVTMVIFRITLHYSGGVEFYLMDYLINSNDLYEIFMAEILIAGLGAIMDVAISIASTIHELIAKNPYISAKQLFVSGRQVGYDIMGTMISVLLFTFICGSFPMILLQMKNGYSIYNTITMHMTFEIYRFLIGSIGILLTVPISIISSILIMKNWKGWKVE